jgi:hypothetical protein
MNKRDRSQEWLGDNVEYVIRMFISAYTKKGKKIAFNRFNKMLDDAGAQYWEKCAILSWAQKRMIRAGINLEEKC